MVTPHTHPRLLASSPPFLEVYPDLLEALWGRKVIVYNASYDVVVLGGNAQQKHGDLGQGRPVLEVLDEEVRNLQRADRASIENGHHRPSVALDDADAERAEVEEAESGGQQDQEVVVNLVA
jgi:DNA polymerase III epsilon subunit-like protein